MWQYKFPKYFFYIYIVSKGDKSFNRIRGKIYLIFIGIQNQTVIK